MRRRRRVRSPAPPRVSGCPREGERDGHERLEVRPRQGALGMAIVYAVDDEVTALLARVVAGVVPSLIERLRSAQPRRVYRGAMALMERPLLHHALALTGGNQLQAARLLGVNRNTLRKRCLELGLAPSATRVATGRRRPTEVPTVAPAR